jgi:hypothetical protein
MLLIEFNDVRSYLRGTITDANTALPLPGAEVKILQTGQVDSTDALGKYSMTLAQGGTYDIQASKYLYATEALNQALATGDTAVVNFDLTPVPTGSMSGTFSYPQGAGIPNAIVQVRGTPLRDTTDVNGAYSFPLVPEGTQNVVLDFWTCIPESAQATISSGLANSVVNFVFQGVAFAYNFEDSSTTGWAVNAGGGDNATTGIWTRVDPNGSGGGTVQPEDDHSPAPLTKCWVTGQGPVGGGVGDQDVDGGRTTLYSSIMDLSTVNDPTIQYFRWYTNSAGGDPNNDIWKVQISSNGGGTWVTTDSTKVTENFWKEVRIRVTNYVTPTNQVRVRFIAEDAGMGSVVEAAVDDFRVWGQTVVAVGDGTGPNGAPVRFALHPNSPNPFNPKTEIRYDLPAATEVHLAVYSMDGRLVRTLASGRLTAGPHTVAWDGKNDAGSHAASGMYVLKLEAGRDHTSRKIALVK